MRVEKLGEEWKKVGDLWLTWWKWLCIMKARRSDI